jgi:two-component system response regulator CpxR
MRPRKKILCVDCNEQTLSVRKFFLETRGFRVVAVETSDEALAILERAIPYSIDLMICELLMPQMDGNELVRRAKQLRPELATMIVCDKISTFDRALHADVFLPKGCSSPGEIYALTRRLVARKRGPKPVWSQAERVA